MVSTAPDLAYLLGALVGGFVAGMLCGMIPYYFGKKRKQPQLALAGLMACTLSGVVLGLLLALPVAGAFSLAIALRSQPNQPKAQIADEPQSSFL